MIGNASVVVSALQASLLVTTDGNSAGRVPLHPVFGEQAESVLRQLLRWRHLGGLAAIPATMLR
ncbi:MAG: hypothetical protein IPG33_07620 [Betaproteobacteria bacterium]|nr:hypothetical protein [Betaproteobacteria bacterium]